LDPFCVSFACHAGGSALFSEGRGIKKASAGYSTNVCLKSLYNFYRIVPVRSNQVYFILTKDWLISTGPLAAQGSSILVIKS
jgi:hypothetical protein